MKIIPYRRAHLIMNRIPAPIPGSLVSRLEAGLLTEASLLPPSRKTKFSVAQWQAIGHHSSGNCPGFSPDSLLSPQGTPQIGGKSTVFSFMYNQNRTIPVFQRQLFAKFLADEAHGWRSLIFCMDFLLIKIVFLHPNFKLYQL